MQYACTSTINETQFSMQSLQVSGQKSFPWDVEQSGFWHNAGLLSLHSNDET